MIRFIEPLWLLAVLPVLMLVGLYVWAQFRRRAAAIRFSNVELLKAIAPRGLGWRRHLPAAAFLAALLILGLTMARPAADTKEPLERGTIMLALDVSLSMKADDIEPSRIQAAKVAAKQFVKELPRSFNVGLVSFAKTANVVVSPTKDHDMVRSAIDALAMEQSTATGEAVFSSLTAIQSVPADGAKGPPPARIVLLSDGYRNIGRSTEDAAEAATTAGVPVSTIAFGTQTGTVDINGQTVNVPVDRVALEKLAQQTDGKYYEAVSAGELKQVYKDMGSSLGYHTKAREVGQWFIGVALLFAFAAAGMSLLWTSRLP